MKKAILVVLLMLGVSAHAEKYAVTCLAADGRAYLNLKPEQIRDINVPGYGHHYNIELVDRTKFSRWLKVPVASCLVEVMANNQSPVLDSFLNK